MSGSCQTCDHSQAKHHNGGICRECWCTTYRPFAGCTCSAGVWNWLCHIHGTNN